MASESSVCLLAKQLTDDTRSKTLTFLYYVIIITDVVILLRKICDKIREQGMEGNRSVVEVSISVLISGVNSSPHSPRTKDLTPIVQ